MKKLKHRVVGCGLVCGGHFVGRVALLFLTLISPIKRHKTEPRILNGCTGLVTPIVKEKL